MAKNAKKSAFVEEFVNEREATVLRALQTLGCTSTIDAVATYLFWTPDEVYEITTKLHAWKLTRRYENAEIEKCILILTQYGEIALLKRAGYNFARFLQLEAGFIKECQYYAAHL